MGTGKFANNGQDGTQVFLWLQSLAQEKPMMSK